MDEQSSDGSPRLSSPDGHGADRAEPSWATRGSSLFTGVEAVCDTAVRLSSTDGAAVAVLTSTTRVRELAFATDALAQQIDEMQFVLGEGPCLDAHRHARPELLPRLRDEWVGRRWPAFAADVQSLGVAAVFAVPVPGVGGPLGVLELYRRTEGDLQHKQLQAVTMCADAVGRTIMDNWDRHTVEAGSVEAAADAVAMTGSERDDDQSEDPFTRTQIYIAAGMVAVQRSVSTQEGLALLRAHAYSSGRPLTAVAADLVTRRMTLGDQRGTAGGDGVKETDR